MARKRYTHEQIIGKLRAIEVHINSGMTSEQAARREEISVQSYFRWRKEYGGMKVDQAKRLKDLEKESLGPRSCWRRLTWIKRCYRRLLRETFKPA